MAKRLTALLVVSIALLGVGAGSAAAATISVEPQTPYISSTNNSFPFGIGTTWTPFAAFIYRNVPAFELKTGDSIAFDTRNSANGTPIQLDFDLAKTTFNGSDIASGPFTTVVLNNQSAAPTPGGDATEGNFELGYKAIAPFSFPGGGLIIRVSHPSATYAADASFTANLGGAAASDPSGFFVERSTSDPDGVAPWQNSGVDHIAAFRITTAGQSPAAATCQGKTVTISGSNAAETISGTPAADVINALGGNDKVVAKAGNDIVCGGDGKDTISGGAGKDRINGENGADLLRGGKGKDIVKGGKGKDTMVGGPKDDLCAGGPGKDTARNC